VLWGIRIGTSLGLVGYVMMLFYFGPALVGTIRDLIVGNLSLDSFSGVFLVFVVALPLVTATRLVLNVSLARRQRA
jgi:hypothetical protein